MSAAATSEACTRDKALLLMSLDLAVPIRMQQIAHWPIDRILHKAECQRLADSIAEHGDVILFRSGGKKNPTAKAFVELVEALARLAYMPGGVEFAGRVYQAERPPLRPRGPAKTWPGPISSTDAQEASKRRRGKKSVP